ncbi:MAG TPA: murein biosynthesis integral membrane protein MurJ [Candidatus Deferrimicrobiaceae bacterium]|jgi:putative peptidoglycan lipid II flippase
MMMTDTTGRQIRIASIVMMASVLLSRILGYARDAVIAWGHGATGATDAYFAAFTIPDFLNYLLAGGSLSITFIPIYARYLAEGREDEGRRVFSTVITAMGIVIALFVIAGELFAERLIPLIAPGFPPAQVEIAARLTRIVLPAQTFFYFGGLLMAVQYAHKRFLIPALAPLVYNAGIIVGGLTLGARYGMDGFAWGVLGGSFLGNFALQAWGAARTGLRYSPRLDLSDPGLREFVKLSIPIMLGFSLTVVDEWMLRVFGSLLVVGTITWINNARRLMQVPVGVLGQASGVASYPFLSALAARGETEEMWKTLSSTLRWVFFVSCALSAATFVLSKEVVLLVFHRGAFGIADTANTALALSAFAIGIPFWCAQSIVARGFFAMKDTWTPTIVGTGALFLTLPLYWFFRKWMGLFGLSLASSAGIVLYATVLYGRLMRKTVGAKGLADAAEFGRIFLASAAVAVLGSTLLPGAAWLPDWTTVTGALLRISAVGVLVVVAVFAVAFALGSTTVHGIHRLKDLIRPPATGA